MKVKNEQFLSAPVPGMSLTAEPKSRPWRRPSDVNTVDEALATLYAPVFKDKKATKMMLQQIQNGVPLTTIADILITANAMEGRHTLDVGILVSPVLIETMITMAEMAEIEYVIGNEERELPEERTELVNRAMRSIKEREDMEDTDQDQLMESIPEEEDAMPKEEDIPVRTGLMARKEMMQ